MLVSRTCFIDAFELVVILMVQVEGDTLYIDNAQPEDRGLYLCDVENEAGHTRASAILEVERTFLNFEQIILIFKVANGWFNIFLH